MDKDSRMKRKEEKKMGERKRKKSRREGGFMELMKDKNGNRSYKMVTLLEIYIYIFSIIRKVVFQM